MQRCDENDMGGLRQQADTAEMSEHSNYVRAWRLHRHTTQEELSEASGVDRTQISKIESGKRQYNQAALERIALALRCEVVDLVGRDPADNLDILSVWERIPDSEKARALEMLSIFIPD